MSELPPVRIDRASDVPPFEQVRTRLAAAAASGELAPGTRLPPVRALAAELGLAVNTVARVYKELEADGVVETRGRGGTVVRGHGTGDGPGTGAEATAAAAAFVATCRRLGLARSEAVRLVEDGWAS